MNDCHCHLSRNPYFNANHILRIHPGAPVLTCHVTSSIPVSLNLGLKIENIIMTVIVIVISDLI